MPQMVKVTVDEVHFLAFPVEVVCSVWKVDCDECGTFLLTSSFACVVSHHQLFKVFRIGFSRFFVNSNSDSFCKDSQTDHKESTTTELLSLAMTCD
jgi:hypothetical protein